MATVPPKITLEGSTGDYDSKRVLHGRVEDGWLVVHAFGVTDTGTVDLIGFVVEASDISIDKALLDRLQTLSETWAPPTGGPTLTSRRLRVSAAAGSSLQAARAQLPMMLSLIDVEQPSHNVELAKLVVRYSELLDQPGARERLARERGVTVNTIKTRLREARLAGLWITSTPGKPGQPSATAIRLAKGQAQ